MANEILIEPFALNLAGAAPSLAMPRGGGASNLFTPDPREIWVDSAVGSPAVFDIDLGSVMAWDSIMLVNTNGAPTAMWDIGYGTAGYTTTWAVDNQPMRTASEDIADANGPAFFWSPAVLNSRYIRIQTRQFAPANPLTIGAIIIGKSWRPYFGREYGAGRPPVDTGVRQRLDDGTLAIMQGKIRAGYKWVFGDLDDSELKKLWGMVRRRRTTLPIVLAEDPANPVAEGLHYGTFAELESYERNQQSKSRWALTIEEWI